MSISAQTYLLELNNIRKIADGCNDLQMLMHAIQLLQIRKKACETFVRFPDSDQNQTEGVAYVRAVNEKICEALLITPPDLPKIPTDESKLQ